MLKSDRSTVTPSIARLGWLLLSRKPSWIIQIVLNLTAEIVVFLVPPTMVTARSAGEEFGGLPIAPFWIVVFSARAPM
ncbi:fructokinase [Leifsonia xyli subsp. cynodontis DSM 46306]|uniref:Uncharacterized protein n=1 Tax=Leifsonia xyli subsp. cynodontis DSM 46306 TaxID=1389489 RepID=U3P602_LEIXC|nr:hypothetical protein [Leifsonia xyli]AGW41236.1 fructokinase [Leifsonia xyli subsp. cynodontis DSM 46306]